MPRSIALRKQLQGRRGYLSGGTNLYISYAAYSAYLADSRPTAADKAIAVLADAAALTALGITDAGGVNLTYTAKDGTLSTKTSGSACVVEYDRGATTNLFLNSATLSTQTVTVVSGKTYTVSALGTGSITLSSGGSGTLSPGSTTMRGALTFTASGTSVVCTVSGTITQAQFSPGYSTVYLDTAGTILYTAGTPKSQNLATGSGTQSITVVAGCVYSILHQAGGTYTLSGATTGTTTAGTVTTFVASTGTLTLTASSSPTLLQVWEGTASMAYVAGPYSEYPALQIAHEDARTNLCKGSASQWTARGTATKTDASDAQIGAYLQLRGLTAAAANDVYQTVSGLTGSAACQPGVWVRRITASGQLNIADPSAGNGSWGIDLSKLPPYWVWINRASPYISVSTEFTASAGGANGLHFYRASGASAIDVDIAIPTLYSAANADAPVRGIPTTTASVSRTATRVMLPNSYIADAGQMTVWGGVVTSTATSEQAIVCRWYGDGRPIYLNGSHGAIYDGGALSAQASGVIAGVPVAIATTYSGATKSVSVLGGPVASVAYDGTMGNPAQAVGLGHAVDGGLPLRGGTYFLRIGPPAANDTVLQRASSNLGFEATYTVNLFFNEDAYNSWIAMATSLQITSVTGTATNGQLEAGTVATPPILTVSASATRGATLLRLPSDHLLDGGQTTFIECIPARVATGTTQVLLGRSPAASADPVYLNASGAYAGIYDGTYSATSAVGSVLAGIPSKIATTYSSAGLAISVNGATPVTASYDGGMGTSSTTIALGDDNTGANEFAGQVTQFGQGPSSTTSTLQSVALGDV